MSSGEWVGGLLIKCLLMFFVSYIVGVFILYVSELYALLFIYEELMKIRKPAELSYRHSTMYIACKAILRASRFSKFPVRNVFSEKFIEPITYILLCFGEPHLYCTVDQCSAIAQCYQFHTTIFKFVS